MKFSLDSENKYLANRNKHLVYKYLLQKLNKTGGRNNYGRITNFNQGGGHKRKYRFISFKRTPEPMELISKQYDPNRSSLIGLCKNITDNTFSYILLPEEINPNTNLIYTNEFKNYVIGNYSQIKNIPLALPIHNLEMKPNLGGQLIRAAGTCGQIIKKVTKYPNYVQVKLPSGQFKFIHKECMATIGQVSNISHKYKKLRKAGQSRWRGIKPVVRGVAMNPIDHPHGGGQGKTSGGRPSVTPWGKLTKGYPTRSKKKKLF